MRATGGGAGVDVQELQAWLDRRADAERRSPCLDEALISGRFAAYARYRLRLFFLRWWVASAFHLIRVLMLWSAFSREIFLQLLLIETAVTFTSNFWWGVLETLRERVRSLQRQGRGFRVADEIGYWLTASLILATVVSTAGTLWVALRERPLDPAALYVVALVARLAVQLVTRAYHSGVYALRRVYRPAWAVVAMELVSFVAVVAVWPVLGAWTLPFGALAATAAGTALTVHFTRRMYRVLDISPRWMDLQSVCRRRKSSWMEMASAGLSFAAMKLDAVLVFGLFEPGTRHGDVQLFLLFFVLSPTIQAGFDWAQLFYFDLKRLHVSPLAPLLEKYRRNMTRLAWVLGATCWILGSVTGTIFYRRSLDTLYVLLCAFFIARSLASSAQLQAFAAGRYRLLLGTASLWPLGLWLAAAMPGDSAKLAVITAATAAIYTALAWLGQAVVRVDQENWVSLVEWLRLLTAVSAPVRVRSARLGNPRGDVRTADRALRWTQRQFATMLARRVRGGGAVTIVPPDRVAWFEPAGTPIRPELIAALSRGMAADVRQTSFHPTGRSAILAAWHEHGFEAAVGPMDLKRPVAGTIGNLERQFARLFPDGWIVTPGVTTIATAPLPIECRGRLVRVAIKFLTDLNAPVKRSAFDVTALCIEGRLSRIFVAPSRRWSRRHQHWHATIRQANLVAALGSARQPEPARPS
jgi:hypothetical protein